MGAEGSRHEDFKAYTLYELQSARRSKTDEDSAKERTKLDKERTQNLSSLAVHLSDSLQAASTELLEAIQKGTCGPSNAAEDSASEVPGPDDEGKEAPHEVDEEGEKNEGNTADVTMDAKEDEDKKVEDTGLVDASTTEEQAEELAEENAVEVASPVQSPNSQEGRPTSFGSRGSREEALAFQKLVKDRAEKMGVTLPSRQISTSSDKEGK